MAEKNKRNRTKEVKINSDVFRRSNTDKKLHGKESLYKNNRGEYRKYQSIMAKLENKLKKEAEIKKAFK